MARSDEPAADRPANGLTCDRSHHGGCHFLDILSGPLGRPPHNLDDSRVHRRHGQLARPIAMVDAHH